MASVKKSCIDVFDAEMVRGARYDGRYEFSVLEKSEHIPQNLVSFDKRNRAGGSNWLHFYIHDYKFDGLWHNYKRNLDCFRKVAGVITPDFSLYRDMPLALQIESVYRNRAIGYWLQSNGIRIVPNIRWADERTYEFAFDGVSCGGTVAVGSHGCIKSNADRGYFLRGFDEMLRRLRPDTIVVYGRIPKEIDVDALKGSVNIISFDSEFHVSHNKGAA
ncbi:MAG: DUF4417 domain-containing protein [Holophagales bacterium]|jgi:hypothetical protein|nr:DUF4417 domain-containing protein [Holophagales bacterium]